MRKLDQAGSRVGELSLLVWFLAFAGARPADGWTQQSKQPDERPALSRVKAFAPPGATAVVYLDVAAVRKHFLAHTSKDKPHQWDPFTPALEISRKVDWLVSWLPPRLEARGGLDVAGGSITVEDVRRHDRRAKLAHRGNGRYEFGKDAMIVGHEADDLPAGIVLVGQRSLLIKGAIAKLGKSMPKEIAALLKHVDASAPMWGVGRLALPPPDGSKTFRFTASFDPTGRRHSRGEVTFPDAELAEQMARKARKIEWVTDVFGDLLKIERRGAVLSIRIGPDPGRPRKLLAVLTGQKHRKKLTASFSNLHTLTRAALAYASEHDGSLPRHLGELQPYLKSPKVLVSPFSGRKPPKFQDGRVVGETDYVYILEAVKPTKAKPARTIRTSDVRLYASTFVLFHERLANARKGQTIASFLDGGCTTIEIEDLRAALEKTRKELRRLGW